MSNTNKKQLCLLPTINKALGNLIALKPLNKVGIIICMLCLCQCAFSQQQLLIKGKIGFEQKINKIEFGIIEAKKKEKLLKIIPIIDGNFQIDIKVNGLETYFVKYGDRINTFDLGPGIANMLVKDSLFRNILIKDNLAYDEQNLYNNRLLWIFRQKWPVNPRLN